MTNFIELNKEVLILNGRRFYSSEYIQNLKKTEYARGFRKGVESKLKTKDIFKNEKIC